jgi:glycosyltransferase involved in cell wall biosynthesis
VDGELPPVERRWRIATEPLRLLWLIDSLTLGGAEALVLPFARAVKGRADLTVCCLKSIGGNPIEARLRDEGVPVVNLGARSLRDLRAFRSLQTLLRDRRIEVLHAHLTYASIWGAIAARRAGIRSVATLHVRPVTSGWRDRVREWILMRVLRWSGTRIVAVSEAVRRAFEKKYGRVSMNVIHNAVEPVEFERHARPASAREGRTKPRVVTVSVLRAGKGIDILLRAMNRVRAELLIVGDGPMRAAWSVLAGPDVVWAGYRTDVPQLLATSDLFVLPSLDDAFPTVLLEAMAAGLPVVATNVGGIPEIIDSGEVGVLVPPADADALAEAIDSLLNDVVRRERMGRAGRRRVEQEFSTQRWTDRLLTLYGEGR